MGMLFRRICTTKATHDPAVSLNNIIIANIVRFARRHGPTEAIQTTEQDTGVNSLQAIMI